MVIAAAVARQMKEFGAQNMGLPFMILAVTCLAMFVAGPKFFNAIHKGMSDWYEQSSQRAETYTYNLIEQSFKVDKESQQKLEAERAAADKGKNALVKMGTNMINYLSDSANGLKCWIVTTVYSGGMVIGKAIRDLFYFLMKMLFRGMLIVSPLFFAFLVFPETRSTGVNFLIQLFAFCLMPVCFLFGDALMIAMTSHTAALLGISSAVGTTGAGMTAASIIGAASASGAAVAAGPTVLSSLIAGVLVFGLVFVFISIICYVVVPMTFFRIFKGGAASLSGLGSTLMAGGGAVSSAARAGTGMAPGVGPVVGAAASGVTGAGKAALGAAQKIGGAARSAGQTASNVALKSGIGR